MTLEWSILPVITYGYETYAKMLHKGVWNAVCSTQQREIGNGIRG